MSGCAYLRRIATIRDASELRKLLDIVSLHLPPFIGGRQDFCAPTLTGR